MIVFTCMIDILCAYFYYMCLQGELEAKRGAEARLLMVSGAGWSSLLS